MVQLSSDYATFEELLEFANKVREAGGGNPLDALMPAVPADTKQCLIAKNLNFNCEVRGVPTKEAADQLGIGLYDDVWTMVVDNRETRDRIAESLNLQTFEGPETDDLGDSIPGTEIYGVVLPDHIGQVAARFDMSVYGVEEYSSSIDRELWNEFQMYIDESVKEAYRNAGRINADGSITI